MLDLRFRNLCARAAVVALVAVWAPAALSQGSCAPRATVLAFLDGKHDERRVAWGLAGTGRIVDVTVSPDGATWTILVTKPDGTTCIIAAGRNWRAVQRQVGSES